jgi:hypothetical protein
MARHSCGRVSLWTTTLKTCELMYSFGPRIDTLSTTLCTNPERSIIATYSEMRCMAAGR